MENIKKVEFSSVMGSDKENKELQSQLEIKTGAIANEKFEGYQKKCDEQHKNSCDFYQKLDVKDVQKIINKEIDNEIIEDFEILLPNKDSKSEEISIEKEITTSNIEKPSQKKSSFFGAITYVASGVYNVGKNMFYNPPKESLIIQERPLVKQAYNLVLKLLPVQESKEWEKALQAMPEKQLKAFVGELMELPKIYSNKLKEQLGLETDDKVKSLNEVLKPLLSIVDELRMLKNIDEKDKDAFINLKPLLFELVAPIKNTNLQVISDFSLGAMYNINKGRLLIRASEQIEEFKNKNSSSNDISLQYLAKNGFKEHSSSICSSTVWEMELGEGKGNCQQFQKGYCKVLIALPGVEIREIKIPVDLRFLTLNKADQEEIIFSILGEMIASPENDIEKYLSKEGLEEELHKQYLQLISGKKIDHLISEKKKEYLSNAGPLIQREINEVKKEIFDKDNAKLMEILQKGAWPQKWDEEGLKIMLKYVNLVENDALYKFLNKFSKEQQSQLLSFNPQDFESIKKILDAWPKILEDKELQSYYPQKELLTLLKKEYSSLSPEGLVLLFQECKNLLDDPKDQEMFACMKFLDRCQELKKQKTPEAMKKLVGDLLLEREIKDVTSEINKGNDKLREILLKGEWPEKWGEDVLKVMWKYGHLIDNDIFYKYLKERPAEVQSTILNLTPQDCDVINKILEKWPMMPLEKEFEVYMEYKQKIKNFDMVLTTLKNNYPSLSSEGLLALVGECRNLMEHQEDEATITSIQVLSGSSELKKEENLNVMRKLLDVMDQETSAFVKNCSGPQGDFQELIETFNFLRTYADDMLQKTFSSLGRDYLHFDGVVSHFEVFPKQIIEHLSSDKIFKKEYLVFMSFLHAIREENIKDHLNGKGSKETVEQLLESFNTNKLNELVDKSSLSNKEKTTVKNYLKYMVELSKSPWSESSKTQILMIDQLLKQWKEMLPGEILTENLQVQAALWLSDPTTCRLVSEYMQYSQIVKEENMAALEKGEKVSMSSYHNMKLHGLTIDLIQNLQESTKPLDKKNLVNMVKEILNSSLDPNSSKDNLEIIHLNSDIDELGELLQLWQKESDPLTKIDNQKLMSETGDGEKSLLKSLERFQELFIGKALGLLPENLSEREKDKLRLSFEEMFKLLSPSVIHGMIGIEEMEKLLDFMDQLKVIRQHEILRFYHPSKTGEGSSIATMFLQSSLLAQSGYLFLPMLPMLETMTPMNSQAVYDICALSSYHPEYLIVLNGGPGSGGDIRNLGKWNRLSIGKEDKMVRDSVKVLVKDNYIVRSGSPHVYQKCLWHMEEGHILDVKEEVVNDKPIEKNSRLLKKGYGEILVSIPTLGTIRSCRFPIDLTPFQLANPEDVSLVLAKISIAGGKTDVTKALMELIESLKNEEGNRFAGIIEQPQLFIETAKKYLLKMEKALGKTLVSINNHNIHFSDVEEMDAQIPQHILEDHFLVNQENIKLWDKFLIHVEKLRSFQMNNYLGSNEIVEIEEDLKKNEEAERNLLSAINITFTHKDDLEIIKAYIENIKGLATKAWDSNDYFIKTIEKSISTVASLDKKKNLKDLRALLLPFLIDANCLKAFKDWTKALEIALNGEGEFGLQRLEKKKIALLELLKNRPEIAIEQKKSIEEWIQEFFKK